MTIPRAASIEHVKENRGAVDLMLTRDDVIELDEAFAPPPGPQLELS
jgi:diketogulonate reductase-like aldo/keto reductase